MKPVRSIAGLTLADFLVVRDGNIITGGGVTAGIDFAITLAAELTDPAIAQSVQLVLEYAPAPPFDAGTPDCAPPDVLTQVRTLYAKAASERRTALEQAAAAYRSRKEKGNC